jgi:hypothetical protein
MGKMGESNGKLPLRTCPGCSVPEPYRSPDWALVPVQTGPIAEYPLLLLLYGKYRKARNSKVSPMPDKG